MKLLPKFLYHIKGPLI